MSLLKTIAAFLVLLAAHSIAAVYSPIQDCDETFNFWEPTHYLNHGYGMQTWEFSPIYAIRSWLYTASHAVIIWLIRILAPSISKNAEFYSLRLVFGSVCAASETRLFTTISQTMNQRIAFIFLVICASSAGMFHASVSYLPSSFAMYTITLALADFMDFRGSIRTSRGLTWLSLGTIVGWPFVGVMSVPFVLGDLITSWMDAEYKAVIFRLIGGLVQSLCILALEICFDSFFYRELNSIPVNIIRYNVLPNHDKGPDIYGTEPWHFYIRNLLINFGLWFPLACISLPVYLLYALSSSRAPFRRTFFRAIVFLSPFYLWLFIFCLQPHKEERFMYPVYPCIALNAAISLHFLLLSFGKFSPSKFKFDISSSLKLLLVTGFMFLAIIMGLWRIAGLTSAYSAPLYIYRGLQHHSSITQNVDTPYNVCIGKEWFRFPSSYHIPSNMRLKFIRSDFKGLLPGEFNEDKSTLGFYPGTWLVPHGMNDRNIEDPGKYSDLEICDFLVDASFQSRELSNSEPDFVNDQERWEKLDCLPFLDTSRTGTLGRLFWIPEVSFIPKQWRRQWADYCLLGRRKRN